MDAEDKSPDQYSFRGRSPFRPLVFAGVLFLLGAFSDIPPIEQDLCWNETFAQYWASAEEPETVKDVRSRDGVTSETLYRLNARGELERIRIELRSDTQVTTFFVIMEGERYSVMRRDYIVPTMPDASSPYGRDNVLMEALYCADGRYRATYLSPTSEEIETRGWVAWALDQWRNERVPRVRTH